MARSQIRVGGVKLDLESPALDRFTWVGSQQKDLLPESEAELRMGAARIARALVPKGISIVSGGTDGVDRIAEDAFGRNVISFRTEHRPNEPSFVRVLSDDAYRKAEKMVASIHPAWGKVKPEHRPLHARNMAHVLQDHLTQPTRFLVTWAPAKGVSIDGTSRSAFELSRIVHGMDKTLNLTTPSGRSGFARELRDMGVPIERGSWYPRETLSLKDHAKQLLESGHARIGIIVPVGVAGTMTTAERLNIGPNYAGALELAKNETVPSVIGDAWESRIVLIAVPQIQRDENSRTGMLEDLNRIAKSNALSRVVFPHEDLEPNRDVYKDVAKIFGAEGVNDTPFTFVTIPQGQRGLARDIVHGVGQDSQRSTSKTQTRQTESHQLLSSR